MQSFLISLLMAVLEKLLIKGTAAFQRYMDLKKALEENEQAAKEYQKTVDNPSASLEDRKKAEDDLLS